MRHGYTNATRTDGDVVTKAYVGPDSLIRRQREVDSLRCLAGCFPVPDLVACEPGLLTTRLVRGRHGQELIAEGLVDQVLATCGRSLRALQSLDVPQGAAMRVAGVVVHGDFGPNNMILSADGTQLACRARLGVRRRG